MHFRTHVKTAHGQVAASPDADEYTDGMVEHDMHVGMFLDLLDELGIADNTIVMYSTDNGPHYEHLARRRRHALPRREEHQLGGRLARPRRSAGPARSSPAP
jgi:arylsulfatase A-like enzyme